MISDIIDSLEVAQIPWSDVPQYFDEFGAKGARLLCLPRKWTPRFILWSNEFVKRLLSPDNVDESKKAKACISELLAESDRIIFRSSVVGETIWERGTYKSESLQVSNAKIDISTVMKTLSNIVESAPNKRTALIIQSFIEASDFGEFGLR
jgi:hypothetical protein